MRRTKKKKRTDKFRSGFEAKVAKSLTDAGQEFEYEKGAVRYTVPQVERRYIPDFVLPNGRIIEAKGKLDALGRKKILDILASNPQLDYRILFMRDNKLSKTSKQKYSDWCKKKDIVCAVSELGEVPLEWLE